MTGPRLRPRCIGRRFSFFSSLFFSYHGCSFSLFWLDKETIVTDASCCCVIASKSQLHPPAFLLISSHTEMAADVGFPKIKNFLVQKRLGSGSYATVYKALSQVRVPSPPPPVYHSLSFTHSSACFPGRSEGLRCQVHQQGQPQQDVDGESAPRDRDPQAHQARVHRRDGRLSGERTNASSSSLAPAANG